MSESFTACVNSVATSAAQWESRKRSHFSPTSSTCNLVIAMSNCSRLKLSFAVGTDDGEHDGSVLVNERRVGAADRQKTREEKGEDREGYICYTIPNVKTTTLPILSHVKQKMSSVDCIEGTLWLLPQQHNCLRKKQETCKHICKETCNSEEPKNETQCYCQTYQYNLHTLW